ncbi:hypothetical protein LTR37_006291 [Vermiconidia calcicola]|uniref:Uncharacterized protein n=1 Tax=Vermiconidia calcicola TaxID=1690605 RepID=A0ACC3NGK3_9PEZI|nr:hypothetical protein LTR37_006291 [Vermiconidia calcicola]
MAKTISPQELRRHWLEKREIALLDVREEGPYADSHPLFASSVPVSEIEEKLPPLVPRLSAPIVVYDDGEGYVERAATRISALGYSSVAILEGGLAAYSRVGEVYRDVNVPSKAFGELVEAIRHTPSLPAKEVKEIIDTREDVIVVDARRFEEYNTMSIPRGRSCPGGELVYRIHDAAPSPETLSLINAGVPNKVIALRNGTIGWTLEGLDVERGKTERLPEPSEDARSRAFENADRWAKHVGVPITSTEQLARYRSEAETRTLYTLDVRDPGEYARGHPAGFISAPGGQLVQAVDEWVGVRGARIVLYDDDGIRASMTASWLLQMGWDVYVLNENADTPPMPQPPRIRLPANAAVTVADYKTRGDMAVFDLARSPAYRKGHIPGAYYASGPELVRDLKAVPGTGPILLTSPNGVVAAANVAHARSAVSREIHYLSGGTTAWEQAGNALETETRWLSEPKDVYKRPYEGTDNAQANMQSYIDWELQLVAQLANDGVAGFHVVQ